jgi:homocitrate synthase NifV
MIRIIDNTLTALDGKLPSKEDLQLFCELLLTIGVDVIELSIAAYKVLDELSDDCKYMLNLEFSDDVDKYSGFYRYVCHHGENKENVIYEVQMNDAREIVKLRALNYHKEFRIVGLDDLMCGSYEKTMNEIKKVIPNSKINFCPENTYGCASALAVQWILAGGTDITTSFAGCKNNAATEEVLMTLRLAVRHKPNRDLTVFPKLTDLYEKITGNKISNKKPIIGRNIFKVEAGIHADGIKKNPATYEAFEPNIVGRKSEIVIGKHSGLKAIRLKLEELNMLVPGDVVVEELLHIVKEICTEHRKSLNDEEFMRLATEVIANERKEVYR